MTLILDLDLWYKQMNINEMYLHICDLDSFKLQESDNFLAKFEKM